MLRQLADKHTISVYNWYLMILESVYRAKTLPDRRSQVNDYIGERTPLAL